MTAAGARRALISWLAFAIGVTAIPALAAAGDKTLVLLEVEGETTPRLAKSLERMIKTEHEVLPGSVYRDAARRLRAKKLTPNNVKKVCAYLKVDGVLDGTVVQEEGAYKFIVRLRSGSNGIIEKKIPLRMEKAWLSEDMNKRLAERLMVAIDNLPPVDKDGRSGTLIADEDTGKGTKGKGKKRRVDDEADDEEGDEDDDEVASSSRSSKGTRRVSIRDLDNLDGDPGKRKASKRDDDDSGKAKRKGDDEDEDTADDDDTADDEDEDGEETASASDAEGDDEAEDAEDDDDVDGSLEEDAELTAVRTTPRTTPLLLNAGVSFIGRKLAFTSVAGAAETPPGYSGSPVPGAYLVAEAYPAMLAGKKGVLANLGVGVVLDRVIKLNSSVPDSTGMGSVNLSTRMWRYGANLRYRHNFGSPTDANGVSVQAAIGFNTAGFAISKGDAPNGASSVDVPNVNYKYIDAGLGGRIPILGKLSFLAEAKFLSPLSAGQIQATTQYGAASVLGFDGEGALEYQITPNILARLGGRIMYLKYSFDGAGTLDDRDGNGMKDVTGASDRFYGGFLTGGYVF